MDLIKNQGIGRKKLSTREKKALYNLIYNNKNPNTKKMQKFLKRPNVAVTLEAILSLHNLSDEKLTERISQIIYRSPTETLNPRTKNLSTNVGTIDANALQAIRTIWQITGKFVEKAEVGGPGDFKGVDDRDLDKIIDNGIEFLRRGGKDILNPRETKNYEDKVENAGNHP